MGPKQLTLLVCKLLAARTGSCSVPRPPQQRIHTANSQLSTGLPRAGSAHPMPAVPQPLSTGDSCRLCIADEGPVLRTHSTQWIGVFFLVSCFGGGGGGGVGFFVFNIFKLTSLRITSQIRVESQKEK